MTKLSGLIAGMAVALGIPEATVLIAAKGLRRNGLISTGPRGPGAPDMSPGDAANILLALMLNGQVTTDHLKVPDLRALPLHRVSVDDASSGQDSRPPQLARTSINTFGDAIEVLFTYLLSHNHHHFMSVRVFQPHREATVSFESSGRTWKFHFAENSGQDDHGDVMWFQSAVGPFPLQLISDVLRGYVLTAEQEAEL